MVWNLLEVFYIQDEHTNEILQGSKDPKTVYHQVKPPSSSFSFLVLFYLLFLFDTVGGVVQLSRCKTRNK